MTTQKTKTKTLITVAIVGLAVVSTATGFFWYGFRSWKAMQKNLSLNNNPTQLSDQLKMSTVESFKLEDRENNTSQTIGVIGGASTGGLTGGCAVFYGYLRGGPHPVNTNHDKLPGAVDKGYVVSGRWGKGCRESFKIDSPPDADQCKSVSEEGYECGRINNEGYCLCVAK